VHNKCSLSKWLFKLLNEDGIWQEILKKKYLKHKTVAQVEKKTGDSHFGLGSWMLRKCFLKGANLCSKIVLKLDSGRILGLIMSH
jgi:hypothetical protein